MSPHTIILPWGAPQSWGVLISLNDIFRGIPILALSAPMCLGFLWNWQRGKGTCRRNNSIHFAHPAYHGMSCALSMACSIDQRGSLVGCCRSDTVMDRNFPSILLLETGKKILVESASSLSSVFADPTFCPSICVAWHLMRAVLALWWYTAIIKAAQYVSCQPLPLWFNYNWAC